MDIINTENKMKIENLKSIQKKVTKRINDMGVTSATMESYRRGVNRAGRQTQIHTSMES